MIHDFALVVIVIVAAVAASRLWPRRPLAAILLCVAAGVLAMLLARWWHMDLSMMM
ncbi:MAG: hypothetical protein P4L91_14670 [Burkholderiaceae bacterium]|nr:hypothetical protein [Burkholderiaceae bacterium]